MSGTTAPIPHSINKTNFCSTDLIAQNKFAKLIFKTKRGMQSSLSMFMEIQIKLGVKKDMYQAKSLRVKDQKTKIFCCKSWLKICND